jgi:hypothetical protein
MQDDQKHESSRSIGNKSSQPSPSEMTRIAFVLEGEANQVDWRARMVAYMIAKIEPPSSGRSTFLTKREY